MNGTAVAPSSPGVHFPPPFVFVAGFILGWTLERWVRRLPLIEGGPHAWLMIAGYTFVLAGVGVILWGLLTFWRARTTALPYHPASRLVVTGPYRYSRNPMYVGMTLLYTGLAVRLNWGWPLLLLPVVIATLYFIVIRREEHYLAAAFGEEYEAYRRRVRRWL